MVGAGGQRGDGVPVQDRAGYPDMPPARHLAVRQRRGRLREPGVRGRGGDECGVGQCRAEFPDVPGGCRPVLADIGESVGEADQRAGSVLDRDDGPPSVCDAKLPR
ncbi:MAG: hypothetical protein CSB46_10940, partial [Micrococcales bacterium]